MEVSLKTTTRRLPLSRRYHAKPGSETQMLGDWELFELIGQGQWSRVYQARPVGSDREQPADYAVKVVQTSSRPKGLARSLLCREALVSREVSASHLVAVLASDLDHSSPHLVMPLLDGLTLERIMTIHGRLPSAFALWIARQVGEAISALHEANWIHADIKPGNIIVSAQGHATLLDLGFASRAGSNECEPSSAIRGSMTYMAPEMISSAVAIDEQCDIYSLGVTLYQMLTGQLPFADKDLSKLAAAHIHQRVPNPRRYMPNLHPHIAKLVQVTLAKEPLRRPTASELVDQLAELEISVFDERVA